GCCPNNEHGLKLKFYEDGDDIVSQWIPQAQYQGWIDTLHGGIQALLLDEISGWVVTRKLQTTGVTSKMETQYLKPVHTSDSCLTLRARLVKQVRNIAFIEAGLYDSAGVLCTKAVCTYFCFSKEKAAEEMGFCGCELEEEAPRSI
ncbi:MAG: PaaI family thioesterase, partial [Bacteroides sp.]|nr:PaaI family thioesterase [Roseburia sp.]MCM1347736.1 PaaI family thioesterase [Bacteroides sp.]MCM1421226.1 PaaI family thioesterase [Bacteroides sp.]